LTPSAMVSSMTRCEHDVSGSVRLAKHADVTEARIRQEMLRLVDGIKVVDGRWKGSNQVLVFLRSKRENKAAAHLGYAINFLQMSERIFPEIQSVNGIHAIERFVWIWNLIAACSLYFDQAFRGRVAIIPLSQAPFPQRCRCRLRIL